MNPVDKRKQRAIQRRLRSWFRKKGRALPWRGEAAGNYVRVVSEVLLQRTRAETVAAMLPAFVQTFPSWEAIASASEEELVTVLKPIGLWRRRATALAALASRLAAHGYEFPTDRADLLAWPAVGPYVASAVMLFEHDRRVALIDEGVARMLHRAFACRTRVDLRADVALWELANAIIDARDSRLLNWAVLDVVSAHCRPRVPLCKGCPLAVDCIFLAQQTPGGG